MNAQGMALPQGGGRIDPQAIRLLMEILAHLRRNPQSWPRLYQIAVQAGIPQQILPPPNAPLRVLAQFARKLVMFLRAYAQGGAQPAKQPPTPVLSMAYGGPVLDVTSISQDRPVMAMALGGRVDYVPALLRPGEYVATKEAIAADPTLDDRISAMNRATAGGMEGPILLAQKRTMDTIPAGMQRSYIELNPDLYGSKAAASDSDSDADSSDRGYKTGSDYVYKEPSREVLERHRRNAEKEIRENMRRKKQGK